VKANASKLEQSRTKLPAVSARKPAVAKSLLRMICLPDRRLFEFTKNVLTGVMARPAQADIIAAKMADKLPPFGIEGATVIVL